MSQTYKTLSVFALLALLILTFTTPAQAFDGRSGDKVVIEAGEVIEDDLYVTASTFILDGTVKGDLIVAGQTITINGTVDGDIMAAGQTIVINGTVADDARIAGSVLQIGNKAIIGGDVVAAGAGLEAKDGSNVSGELVVASGQTLLAGNIDGDVMAGTGSLELSGTFGGNIEAAVGEPNSNAGGPPPSMFMPQTGVTLPTVPPGLTIAEGATIKGDLKYTSVSEFKIPSGAVAGKVNHIKSQASPEQTPTPTQKAINWTLDLLRSIVTLIAFGLLLGWLAPRFMKSLMDKAQTQTWPSLGWGVLAYAAFFFALLVIVLATILGGVIFGMLTLGGLSATFVWGGIFSLFAAILGFVLVAVFLTKIVVGWMGGRMILTRIKPELAEHKVWPLVIGAIIVALLVALPFVGWLISLLIMFVGLGTIWLWGRERTNRPVTA